jgi:phage tail sheath protein FI
MAKKFDFLSPGISIREIDQSILPPERDAEGPIIIGRARKGPGNKPVKIKNLDDFIAVFGTPVAGGGEGGDVWRNGNTIGPTLGVYAAQAWLASGESPITYVRLVGDSHPSADTSTGMAGWKLNGNLTTSAATNATAYGLFLADNTADLGQALAFATVSFSGQPGDAETGTITNQDGSVITFEFESGGGVTAGRTSVTIGANQAETCANLVAAIESEIAKGNIENFVVQYNATLDNDVFSIAFTGTTKDSAAVAIGSGITNVAQAGETIAAATQEIGEGALGAIFYVNDGYIVLDGKEFGGSNDESSAGRFIKSTAANRQFRAKIYNGSSVLVETVNFNFDRNSSMYIRNVFNTNPQLCNSSITPSEDLKTYWLGESYIRHVETYVTSTTSGDQSALLLPMSSGSTAAGNWGYRFTGSAVPKSGMVFSQRSTNQQQLFRICGLEEGDQFQKNYMIAVEEIRESTNPVNNPYGTFAIAVKDMSGNSVEKYSNLNLNPASPNYIAKRIGDQYMSWDDSKRRYRTYGDYLNLSDMIRVEMNSNISNGGGGGLLPAGFRGPVRHKSFGLTSGSAFIHSVVSGGIGGEQPNAYVAGGGASTVVGGNGGPYAAKATGDQDFAIKFHFASIPLRQSGSDGNAADPYRVYWGIRPKLSNSSTRNDPDYCDYLRSLPAGISSITPSNNAFEHSFHFSLDDLVVNTSTNVVQYRSGSWSETGNDASTSYTSPANTTTNHNGTFGALLDLGVRQFLMPVFGGRDGLDILEAEPFRNSKIGSTLGQTTNYTHYSLYKAIDAVGDSEVVPANLLLAPGITQPIITDKLISTAESRRDVLAIVDLENDYTQSTESKANSTSRLGSVTSAISSLKARNLDSSYACCFYPAVQVRDNINPGSPYVWVPSSVAALGALASSQAKSEVWFAPAGFNRGGLGNLGGRRGPKVLQARQRLDSRERDDLYQVNINPIATFPAEGVVVFGQKTLQADASALDRINVRRLLLFLKSQVSDVARNLLFDQNVPTTWNRFKSQVNPILSNVKARFGLADYKLVLDETTTTPDLIDRNIMYAKIFIKPARAIEFIVVDFVITKSGADFV